MTLVTTHHGHRELDSSLTAIANGVDDAGFRRWAQALHDYAKPVYLTVLPQVDRNFSASSAVAGGGIPQDSARAWNHIRALFINLDATNVAWVWDPADPGHDSEYSPGQQNLDAVAVTLYEYPHRAWADPALALRLAAARHPSKPLLLEISAAGDPTQKAAWFARMANAVHTRHDVGAVVYHDSGPYADPQNPATTPWSLTSDWRSQLSIIRAFHLIDTRPTR